MWLIISCISCDRYRGQPSVVVVLGATQGESRFTEGRLAAALYAPFLGDQPVPRRFSKADFQALAAVARSLARPPKPGQLADRALVDIAFGHLAPAVTRLEQAAAGAPTVAVIWNDLAVAYMARARASGDVYDKILSFEACEKAIRSDSKLQEARFNLALATEALTLPVSAAKAWSEYLEVDPSSPWANEARRHLSRLASSTATRADCDTRPWSGMLRGGSAHSIAPHLIADCPSASREFAEQEILPAWAKAVAAGARGAAPLLELASRIAQELANRGTDRMLADSVARARQSNDQRSADQLLAGLSDYRDGMGLRATHRLRAAAATLSRAQAELARAHCPFAGWAGFQLAVTHYFLGEYPTALHILHSLETSLPLERYPILRGRIDWNLGLIAAVEANPPAALVAYKRALESFTRGLDSESIAALHSLVAESLSSIGDEPAAWEQRNAALAGVAICRDSTHLQTIFDEAAEASLHRGALHAARLFQAEALGVAERLGDAQAISDALLRRIAMDRQLADSAMLADDRRRAEAYAERIPDADLRRRLQADLAVADAAGEVTQDPAAAAIEYSRAIHTLAQIGDRYPLANLFAARARARERTGDLKLAAEDLQSGLQEVENERARLRTRAQRQDFFARSSALFDTMIAFAIRHLDDPLAAFHYAELKRSRRPMSADRRGRGSAVTVADPSGVPPSAGPLDLDQVRQRLRPDEVLLEYAVLEASLVRWTVRRERVEISTTRIDAARLTREIAGFLGALAQSAPTPGSSPAGDQELSQLLIPRTLLADKRIRRLVIVPDRMLLGLPFAALVDSPTGRFLVESFEIVIAPSASSYVSIPAGALPPGAAAALVLGDPSLPPELVQQMPPLPGALREARGVAALYPHVRLLLERHATKLEFLRSAARFPIIHLAAHAAFMAHDAVLFLAPEGEDPGILTGAEIETMQLPHTRLVVVAACRSAGGRQLDISGLESVADAFLTAGARAVIGSLLDLDDVAVTALVEDLHRQVAQGTEPAAALRLAQLHAIAAPANRASRRFGWASLELFGTSSPPRHPDEGGNDGGTSASRRLR